MTYIIFFVYILFIYIVYMFLHFSLIFFNLEIPGTSSGHWQWGGTWARAPDPAQATGQAQVGASRLAGGQAVPLRPSNNGGGYDRNEGSQYMKQESEI